MSSSEVRKPTYTTVLPEPPTSEYQDCLSCRIIGSGVLATTGGYALLAARKSAPGSVIGKRIVGIAGVGLLIGSAIRWTR
ncbi:hypothetical protein FIBSPDRAFT_803029 [Athelia psychrophila]|uniref:Distal membrane-arm assembly complex protein 1-like domain-containing protein n=1 Tax=Athelia psychrophila TaxID=1759441 RepID=A0A165XE18_9AGAM|nr:hypothetical protein FIBSPDRAFT_803029 [Fibularhizoctonia sp. CBS 109695]